jgi:lipopolysaccharide transport system ATP-binding protein
MAKIILDNASVDLPIYNAKSRSITGRIIDVATGGKIDADSSGRVHVRALSSISLELNDGDRLGLIGHNGAGKSTLLRVLSGVFVPTSGAANIHGNIGSLIDVSLGINTEATGRENIYIRAALLGLPKAEIDGRFDEIVEFSELGDFIEMPVRTYSSGMQLRLAFAVSTTVRPEILLMDEWLSVGDEGFREKAADRLTSVVSASKILVLASHSRDILEEATNMVLWLEHGAVKMYGASKDVLSAYFGPK